MTAPAINGGCQCGAVRFAVTGEIGRASICHCRMCQKAFGGFYAPLVSASAVTWTRGTPTFFQSSNRARRGFCGACGTPLTFEPDDGPVELAMGAFDDPARIRPTIQHGVDTRLPWLSELDGLPERSSEEALEVQPYYDSVRSFQHPDHDT